MHQITQRRMLKRQSQSFLPMQLSAVSVFLSCLLLFVSISFSLGDADPHDSSSLFHFDKLVADAAAAQLRAQQINNNDETATSQQSSTYPAGYTSTPSPSVSSSTQRVVAPSASIDIESLYFENLSPEELEEHYSTPPPADQSIASLVHSLTDRMETNMLVDVVLVGFAGDGESSLVLDTNEVQRYLVQAGLNAESVKQSIDGVFGDASKHDLPFSTKFLFRVNRAHPNLRAMLQQKLQSTVDSLVEANPFIIEAAQSNRQAKIHASGKGTPRSKPLPTIPVSAKVVDSVIEADFKKNGLASSIYFINLAPIYLKEETDDSKSTGQSVPAKDPVRLRYVYTQDTTANSTSPSPFLHVCPTTHWISDSQRYLWFDFSAGPISYGPQNWGDGIQTEYSLPNPRRLLELQNRYAFQTYKAQKKTASTVAAGSGSADGVEINQQNAAMNEIPFKPSLTLDNHFRHQLLAELSALTRKVAHNLLAPPVTTWQRNPSGEHGRRLTNQGFYAKRIRFHVIFMHETHLGEARVETKQEIEARQKQKKAEADDGWVQVNTEGEFITGSTHTSREGAKESNAADARESRAWALYPDGSSATGAGASEDSWIEWRRVTDTILSLGLPDQALEIQTHHLRFEECIQCVQALTHSTKTFSSNSVQTHHAPSHDQTIPTRHVLHTQINQYIDSSEIKDWLEHFDAKAWDLKQEHASAAAYDEDLRVIRVFVYDLASPSVILLDRFHQALSLGDDLIVAVQTRAPSAVLDMSCEGGAISMDTRDCSRATLAEMLTTGWGVVNPTNSWSFEKKIVEKDHLFGTGFTPFSPFSNEKRLSFALRDAAQRNMLQSVMHSSLLQLSSLFPAPLSSSPSVAVSATAVSPTLGRVPPPSHLLDPVLYASPRVDFLRRFNVLSYKIQKARHWLQLNTLSHAFVYIEAARADALILHHLVHREILDSLQQKIECGLHAEKQIKGLSDSSSLGNGEESIGAVLAASNYFFFILLECGILLSIVGCFWFISSNPTLIGPFIARCMPLWMANQLGLSRFIGSKHKHF